MNARLTETHVLKLLQEGEGETVEFKQAFTKEAGKDICAFANSHGGIILFGVTNDGRVAGVLEKKIELYIADLLHGIVPLPHARFSRLRMTGKQLVALRVEKGDGLFTLGNVIYIRVGETNKPLSLLESIERGAELLQIFWDSLPSRVSARALEKEAIQEYLKRREEIRGIAIRDRVKEITRKMKIVREHKGKWVATYGGLLFFSKEPQIEFPQSTVRVVRFEDVSRTLDTREFKGPLWQMIDALEEYFRKNVRVTSHRGTHFRRQIQTEYPLRALREAITNALAHRNYFDPGETQIFLYPDRIEIENPGGFPPGVTVERPFHKPRNPLLCQYLYDFGYLEKYGSGIPLIKRECQDHGEVEVIFETLPYRTKVTFQKRTVYRDPLLEKVIHLLHDGPKQSGEIAKRSGISKVTAVKYLKRLVSQKQIHARGKGRFRYYEL